MSGRTQNLLAALTGLVATFGYAGALGLLTGAVDLGATVDARLPWHHPVLVGVAEAAMMAVPMTVVTWLAVKGDARTAWAAVVAGALLVLWVLLELAIVGEFSWLEAVLGVAGLAVSLVGLRERMRPGRAVSARHNR